MTASDVHPSPLYSVRAAAARAGVPTATVRSWNRRYDIGPQHRSAGRHRLYTESDVAVLIRMVALVRSGASPASAARAALSSATQPAVPVDPAVLIDRADRLEAAGLVQQISASLRVHGVVATWEQSLRPAFARVDARQRRGEQCIDIEHTLSWAAVTSLHRIEPVGPDKLAPIMLACVDGDLHTLPLEALRAALAEHGRNARMLGPLPQDALAAAICRHSSAPIVVLWAQCNPDPAAVSTARSAGAAVTIAGPGWANTQLSESISAVSTLEDAVALLTPDQPRSSHGDRDSNPQ